MHNLLYNISSVFNPLMSNFTLAYPHTNVGVQRAIPKGAYISRNIIIKEFNLATESTDGGSLRTICGLYLIWQTLFMYSTVRILEFKLIDRLTIRGPIL